MERRRDNAAGIGRAAGAEDSALCALRADFPQFRIWPEVTGARTLYVARRLRRDTHPHTLVTADLIRRIGTGADAESTPDSIRTGAAPEWAHFANFILQPGRLSFYFPPYQVASYASGPQESHIPLAALKGFLRANVRVAVPSFDCAKAGSAIARAICADVPLARLDRRLAEAYAAAVRSADARERQHLLRAQREWLAQQGAMCGGKAGRALHLCLMTSYRARAKALAWP